MTFYQTGHFRSPSSRNWTGLRSSPNIARPTEQTGQRSRPRRDIDATRAGGLRACHRGNTNKEVARALGGTERTIKAHRQRVMTKMQVQSIVELVSLAERAGVLDSASSSRLIA